jgi:guanylate cyclase
LLPNQSVRITKTKFGSSIAQVLQSLWIRVSDHPSAVHLGRAILAFLVFAESSICIFWIFALSSLGDGYVLMAAVPYLYIVISYVSLLIFYHLKRVEYFIFIQLTMLLVIPFFMQWVIGGFEASSGVAIWALLSPVGALMILGTRQSAPWFGLFSGLVVVSWVLNSNFSSYALPIPAHTKSIFFVINLAGVATILYVVLLYFQAQKERALKALAIERDRSDKLLLNILPLPVANRLKMNETGIADSHEAVTIMFADLIDFTKLSADMPASELVDLLNQVFSEFDQLAEKYGLEKIKTIGDAYMLAGGVPDARNDHAEAVADMALEMLIVLAEIAKNTGKNLVMRIGIHSGPVVAGVIGSSKFSYDLWGETVNMASSMERYGLPDTIQITEATYQLLQHKYAFVPRGRIATKGGIEVVAFILTGKLTCSLSK